MKSIVFFSPKHKSYRFSKKVRVGDGFTTLNQSTKRVGSVDTDPFAAYFGAYSPVAAGPQNRIAKIP